MTYFWFLIIFIGIPLFMFSIVLWSIRQRPAFAREFSTSSILISLFLMAFIALIYTPIWDNYLVGNRIWFYDQAKVIGMTLGYVPLEEYAFFILQSFLIGIVLFTALSLLPRKHTDTYSQMSLLNWFSAASLLIIWIFSLILFLERNQPFTYLALILLWSVPPISFQFLFGLDIIKQRFSLLMSVIVLSTIYLSIVDSLAIEDGIWTISSDTSTGILIGGILPVEELVFFLVTNILIVIGLFLLTDQKSKIRIKHYLNIFQSS